ncbi:hypothetical protein AKJ09_02690 [Labilithrix luteola]|uniref:Uncharacterized protein n=1 Tax=Labilithrix luteola TaxID=1391654 RepID=A0A0K1PRM0_9BACT|nr:hypothetical protein [Labilithrix luteola]AKU96026.1 hypothetical protein AKJ09_02690 [Labilithrix luteola]
MLRSNQTFPVLPMKLDSGATLYNGTHFGTLAEGSYHASVTGKNGCSGTAAIDFKVTPKVSTKKVLGKPTISFWRVKVRAYKFKTEFEWSDWLEFKVDQN